MRNTQQGFTLIELVVVIVVIGILSIAAVPLFIDISADARNATADGVAAAITSGSSINYGASLAGSTTAVAINTATSCSVANLQGFVGGVTLNTGTTAAAAYAAVPNETFDVLAAPVGVCTAASVGAGTIVPCEIAARGGSAVAIVSLTCTGP
jgi:prepilin-type N-terminal cleavage/methylation domain-containing protein